MPSELSPPHTLNPPCWAIQQGIFTHHPLNEVPDDIDIEGHCQEIRSALKGTAIASLKTQNDGIELPPLPDIQTGRPSFGVSPFNNTCPHAGCVTFSGNGIKTKQNKRREKQSHKMMTHRSTRAFIATFPHKTLMIGNHRSIGLPKGSCRIKTQQRPSISFEESSTAKTEIVCLAQTV